jgi:glycosyltransferase involved in cell wall biosynthesis
MKKRICFIVSALFTAEGFLKDHIEALSEYFDVYLVGNFTDDELISLKGFKLSGYKVIRINRNINIKQDFHSVIRLYKYFKEMDFYCVHSVSPKAGLVTSLSGFIFRVPNRIHIFTGQVWANKKGLTRIILMFIDWLIAHLNTLIMVDGFSQRDYLIQKKILKEKRSIVIGEGSIAGVNTHRFNPRNNIRMKIRSELNLLDNQIVYIFLGRLNTDKGINELFMAFNKLSQEDNNVYLLLVGVDEESMLKRIPNFEFIKPGVNFQFYGKTSQPEVLLQAGDIFCLPSYREGFGSSVIEASCLGLPVICSDAYGLKDAMIDNVTGLRCKMKDKESLYLQMKILSKNSELRNFLGQNGRERILTKFSGEFISNEWLKIYQNLK